MATQGTRAFRNESSYGAERRTRDKVQPFLERKGFTNVEDVRRSYGQNESQLVSAVDPSGRHVKLHVKSCWSRDRGRARDQLYAAAQLMTAIKDGDWEGSIRDKVARSESQDVTHMLFIQREGDEVVYAAMVPTQAVLPIWIEQRRVGDKLIAQKALGRQRKNHAANGKSPTIWLQDDRAPRSHEVPDVLWNYPGVVDLVNLPDTTGGSQTVDDTYDDCNVDYEQLGSDGAKRETALRSMVKRDRRVRAEVLKRAKGACERSGCAERRNWPGFLDVHHILGADKSDRVWNCVALCPSCHREAHFAPDQVELNAKLLEYANAFR